jgi:hypothetical protein
MESKRKIYLIIVNIHGDVDVGPYFNPVANRFMNTTAVATTVKKAYAVAIHMGNIEDPDSTYRKVADSLRLKGVAFIGRRGTANEEPAAVITRVNSY